MSLRGIQTVSEGLLLSDPALALYFNRMIKPVGAVWGVWIAGREEKTNPGVNAAARAALLNDILAMAEKTLDAAAIQTPFWKVRGAVPGVSGDVLDAIRQKAYAIQALPATDTSGTGIKPQQVANQAQQILEACDAIDKLA